jgi:hypothetical protein
MEAGAYLECMGVLMNADELTVEWGCIYASLGFFEPLESHTVRFTAWNIGYGIPRRLRSFFELFQRASSILACCLTYCGYYNSLIRILQLSIWQLDFNPSYLSWSRGDSDFTSRENTFSLRKAK